MWHTSFCALRKQQYHSSLKRTRLGSNDSFQEWKRLFRSFDRSLLTIQENNDLCANLSEFQNSDCHRYCTEKNRLYIRSLVLRRYHSLLCESMGSESNMRWNVTGMSLITSPSRTLTASFTTMNCNKGTTNNERGSFLGKYKSVSVGRFGRIDSRLWWSRSETTITGPKFSSSGRGICRSCHFVTFGLDSSRSSLQVLHSLPFPSSVSSFSKTFTRASSSSPSEQKVKDSHNKSNQIVDSTDDHHSTITSDSDSADEDHGIPSTTCSAENHSDTKSDNQQKDGNRQPPIDSSTKAPNTLPITFTDVSRAEVAIRGGVVRTTCEKSHYISELVGAEVFFKNEFRQFTGSFKERGARNAILQLLRESNSSSGSISSSNKQTGGLSSLSRPSLPSLRGVIAASAGNHALAMAYHGQKLNVPVTVVMPTTAPLAKVDKCRRFGARIIIHGQHIGEAKVFAEKLVVSENLKYVNGYDDPPILAGAGTIGMEIIDDIPDVDVVVVPVGGAGLIAGISCAIKTLKPDTKVIGVEPVFCASYTAALKAGKPVEAHFTPTLADGLAVPVVGSNAFKVARHYVDECVLTSEKEISLAVLRLLENEKVVVEGGGAAGLAALLPGGALDRDDMKGKRIVVPLCGGNIDTTVLGRVLERGLAADQRLVQFVATVSDRPGGIAKLTELLADNGASIKDIYHERAWLHTSVSQVQVKCVVELQGVEHGNRVRSALLAANYPIIWNVEY